MRLFSFGKLFCDLYDVTTVYINIRHAWYQLGKCATYKDETFQQDEQIKVSFSALDLFSPTQMQCHQRQHLSHCTHNLPCGCLHFFSVQALVGYSCTLPVFCMFVPEEKHVENSNVVVD